MQRKGNPSALFVGIQNVAATVENNIEFPQKAKSGTAKDPVIPSLGLYPKNPETPIQKNQCTAMLIAAQFTIAKSWKQPKCPSINEWIKKLWYINKWNTILQKELLLFMTAWIELESIMLSEINQVEIDKYHMISSIRGT